MTTRMHGNDDTLPTSSKTSTSQDIFQPVRMLQVELSEALPTVTQHDPEKGQDYSKGRSMIRLHTIPLGLLEVDLQAGDITPEAYAALIWDAFADAINDHLEADGLERVNTLTAAGLQSEKKPACVAEVEAVLADAPFVSVVICTHERRDSLEIALDSLFEVQYPNYEVLIVDNAPRTDATRTLIEEKYSEIENLRYVVEPHQGQSWARNRGALDARGEIIAYTDDDVVVDPHWLTGLVAGFEAGDNVACVTGLILPTEWETPSQAWFEMAGGFLKGWQQRLFDMDQNKPDRPFYPLSGGIFGTGASMAIRRDALLKVGGFDEVLGAGTITGCGEDLAIYAALLLDGYQLVYEPRAFLYHSHRREYTKLQQQLYNYGVGFTAFLTSTLLARPAMIPGFLAQLPYGAYLALSPGSIKNSKKDDHFPQELTTLERRGMLYGPIAYVQNWFSYKRDGKKPLISRRG